MKISHPSHTLLQVLIALNLSFYVTISRSIINVQAQQQGCIVPGRGSNAAFAPNSRLTVYLDPSYTKAQRNAVMSGLSACHIALKGLKNWNYQNLELQQPYDTSPCYFVLLSKE